MLRTDEQEIAVDSRKRAYDLGLGATPPSATSEADYGATRTVTDSAARRCDEARLAQITVSQRALGAVESLVVAKEIGPRALKGLVRLCRPST